MAPARIKKLEPRSKRKAGTPAQPTPLGGRSPRLVVAIPWIACTDIGAMFAFFEEKLGFEREWTWGDPPTDGGVKRDGVSLYLCLNPDVAGRAQDTEITLIVEDVDALYKDHTERGAPIEMDIRDEPWGSREYHVRVPNGSRLRFSGEPGAA